MTSKHPESSISSKVFPLSVQLEVVKLNEIVFLPCLTLKEPFFLFLFFFFSPFWSLCHNQTELNCIFSIIQNQKIIGQKKLSFNFIYSLKCPPFQCWKTGSHNAKSGLSGWGWQILGDAMFYQYALHERWGIYLLSHECNCHSTQTCLVAFYCVSVHTYALRLPLIDFQITSRFCNPVSYSEWLDVFQKGNISLSPL